MALGARPLAPRPPENPKCVWCSSWPCRCEATRTTACSCGGLITATGPDPSTVMAAVVKHQESARHTGWRMRLGL
jgi:hypothetical protein